MIEVSGSRRFKQDSKGFYVARDVELENGRWQPQHLELVDGAAVWVDHEQGGIMRPVPPDHPAVIEAAKKATPYGVSS
jgi:hypothetical protein